MSFIKRVNSVLDYTVDWTKWLVTDKIYSHVVTASPGITINSTDASDTKVVAWLSGGTHDEDYTITCQITTLAGRTDERTFDVKVL